MTEPTASSDLQVEHSSTGVVRPIELIAAPSSLGLKPNGAGREPDTWRGPGALLATGLAARLGARVAWLAHPAYVFEPQPGTRIRNGVSIRAFSLELAAHVAGALARGVFPIVLGGDCSILLGCLLGNRHAGGRGLVHVDGHSDFFHPGNYDTATRLGSAAGMDLALATGRGEPLLTCWPDLDGPLVDDRDACQVGERDAETAEFEAAYGDIVRTAITQTTIQQFARARACRGRWRTRRLAAQARASTGVVARRSRRARSVATSCRGFARLAGAGLRWARCIARAARRVRARCWDRLHDLRPGARSGAGACGPDRAQHRAERGRAAGCAEPIVRAA